MTVKRVAVDLDSKVWWELAEKAEEAGVETSAFLADLAKKYVAGKLATTSRQNKGPDTLLPQVLHLHAVGWSDARIGEALRCSPSTVARKRETLGLLPHGKTNQQGGAA